MPLLNTTLRPQQYLNPDMCFAAWLVTGSLQRAMRRLRAEGIKNPFNGNPVSLNGVYSAAKRSEYYPEFAKRHIIKDELTGGNIVTEVTEAEFKFFTDLLENLLSKEPNRLKRVRISFENLEEPIEA